MAAMAGIVLSPRSSIPLHSTFCSPLAANRRQLCCARRGRTHKCDAYLQGGMGAEVAESIVQFQERFLQTAVDLGFPLSSYQGVLTNWAILPVALVYLNLKPGALFGLIDFIWARIHSISHVSFSADEVEVGRQIGEGSFGIVYEGYIRRGNRKGSQKKDLHVVLKKVKPRSEGAATMQDAEVYMNYRAKRTASNACAKFLGTIEVSSSQAQGRLSQGLWLVWKFEGDRSLDFYMRQRNFPENLTSYILGEQAVREGDFTRKEISVQHATIIREIFRQILTNVGDLHKAGVVHRDVKPLNLILAQGEGRFKLVDLGACADLRSGYNYVPDETIMDPTYAAPERHVMPTSTPRLPADPICSLISPLVWLLNTPDRFDIFSVGLILLQMCIKPLRSDVGLKAFNAELRRCDYNLDAWRKKCRYSDEEFLFLDADGGAGWELAKAMLQPRHDSSFFIWPSLGKSRPSAVAALRRRFFRVGKGWSFASGSFIPSAAASASVLAIAWLVLLGLRSSAQLSYDAGHSFMESVGFSGVSFLTLLLLVKRWLLDQEVSSSSPKVGVQSNCDPEMKLAHIDGGTLLLKDRRLNELFANTKENIGQGHTKTGLSETVQAMETQLSSLEGSVYSQQQFSQQRQEQLHRMEKLLTQIPRSTEMSTTFAE